MATQPPPIAAGQPQILARGPWPLERIAASWRSEHYEPSREDSEAADQAIAELRERGSPSHDGIAARLVGYSEEPRAGSRSSCSRSAGRSG